MHPAIQVANACMPWCCLAVAGHAVTELLLSCAASKPVSYKYGTHCIKINQKHKQVCEDSPLPFLIKDKRITQLSLFSSLDFSLVALRVPDKYILTISKEKKMSTFEEAVDIVSNKMNKTLSNDELKEVNIRVTSPMNLD